MLSMDRFFTMEAESALHIGRKAVHPGILTCKKEMAII